MSMSKFATIEAYKQNVVDRKERVQMKDARLGIHMWHQDLVMFGVPLDHPNSRLNGKIITTSPVIKHNEIEVETRNTIYVIQNWEKPYGS